MDRPVFRVGLAGLDPRDARLIEIVFRHGAHNRHEFRLLELLDLTQLDIVIANPVDPEGLDALTAVAAYSRRIPTVSAVPRGSQIAARHSVTIDRLTLQLLPILNRVVAEEGLLERAPQPVALCEELTEIHQDDEDDGAVVAMAVPAPVQAPTPAPTLVPAPVPGLAVAATPAPAPAPAIPASPAAGPLRPPGKPLPESFNAGMADMLAEMVAAVASPDGPPTTARGHAPASGRTPESGDPSEPCDVMAEGIDVCADRMEAEVVAVLGSMPGGHTVSRGRVARVDQGPAGQAAWLAELGGDSVWAPLPAFHPRPTEQRGPALQVLVADPSVAARTRLAEELNLLGMDVFCVASGAAVARAVTERHFDLVIIEAALADTDGLTVLHWLRSKPAWRSKPVMLLQIRPNWVDTARARLDGHLTLVPKPVTRRSLASRLRRVLRHVWVVDEFSPYIE